MVNLINKTMTIAIAENNPKTPISSEIVVSFNYKGVKSGSD